MKFILFLQVILLNLVVIVPAEAETLYNQPESKDSVLIKAHGLRDAYKFDKALKLYQQYCEYDSASNQALSGAAFCAFQLGMLNKSRTYYQKLLLHDSTNRQALNQLAAIAAKMKQYHLVRDLYQKLLVLDSSNAFYHKQMGMACEKLDKFREATMHLRHALMLNEKDTDAALKLANISYKLEQYPDALSTLKSALGHSPDNIALLRLMLKSYYRIDSTFKVMSTGVKLLSMGDTTNNILKMTGMAFFNIKAYQKAIELLTLLPEDQKTPSILYYLGISYREQFYLEKSRDAFDKAIKKGMPPHYERYFIHKSLTQLQLNDHQGAVETCIRGLEITKNDALLFHLARAYDSWYKDKTPAIRYYQKYLRSPDAAPLYREYSERRLKNLRETEHFNAPDTLSGN